MELFSLDQFVFLPAFHAPHKPERTPTSAYHRYAMLVVATHDEPRISVSTLELSYAQRRFTVETLPEIIAQHADADFFFVMGADSWLDIRTWREWEKVLLMTNHIVVTRPGYEITFDHVTPAVRERIVDLRQDTERLFRNDRPRIYVTDAIKLDVSATEIREDISTDDRLDNPDDVPQEVAKYIEKYELYK